MRSMMVGKPKRKEDEKMAEFSGERGKPQKARNGRHL